MVIGTGYGDLPYGDGSDAQQTSASTCLVGTITRLSSHNWVATRTPAYGGLSELRDTYPKARAYIQGAVSQELTEEVHEEPGQPQITYLFLANCAGLIAQQDLDGYGD